MKSGHIYLLKNPAYRPNYHKVGKTEDTTEKRARKLSQATGVPEEFIIVYQHRVPNCHRAESLAKERLSALHHRGCRETRGALIERHHRLDRPRFHGLAEKPARRRIRSRQFSRRGARDSGDPRRQNLRAEKGRVPM